MSSVTTSIFFTAYVEYSIALTRQMQDGKDVSSNFMAELISFFCIIVLRKKIINDSLSATFSSFGQHHHAFFIQAPAKRSQHANSTYRNIVGRNMLCAFGHRVATCFDVLGVVGSNLKMVKFEPTTLNTSQHVATG